MFRLLFGISIPFCRSFYSLRNESFLNFTGVHCHLLRIIDEGLLSETVHPGPSSFI